MKMELTKKEILLIIDALNLYQSEIFLPNNEQMIFNNIKNKLPLEYQSKLFLGHSFFFAECADDFSHRFDAAPAVRKKERK